MTDTRRTADIVDLKQFRSSMARPSASNAPGVDEPTELSVTDLALELFAQLDSRELTGLTQLAPPPSASYGDLLGTLARKVHSDAVSLTARFPHPRRSAGAMNTMMAATLCLAFIPFTAHHDRPATWRTIAEGCIVPTDLATANAGGTSCPYSAPTDLLQSSRDETAWGDVASGQPNWQSL